MSFARMAIKTVKCWRLTLKRQKWDGQSWPSHFLPPWNFCICRFYSHHSGDISLSQFLTSLLAGSYLLPSIGAQRKFYSRSITIVVGCKFCETSLKNWGGNVMFTPKRIVFPQNNNDVVEIVKNCQGMHLIFANWIN